MTDPRLNDSWSLFAQRWEAFQSNYAPEREKQFSVLLDYVEAVVPPGRLPRLHLLDIGGGPGSLAARIILRFPTARITSVDLDPWLIEIGRRALPTAQIQWVQLDLRDPGWQDRLAGRSFDAIVTSTALHWLDAEQLSGVYSGVYRLLARGGVFLNADLIPSGDGTSKLSRVSRHLLFQWQAACTTKADETWTQFWSAADEIPDFRELLDRRSQLLGLRPPRRFLTAQEHIARLRDAGFDDIIEVWRFHAAAIVAASAGRSG